MKAKELRTQDEFTFDSDKDKNVWKCASTFRPGYNNNGIKAILISGPMHLRKVGYPMGDSGENDGPRSGFAAISPERKVTLISLQ